MIKDASDRDNEVQPNEIMATNICRNIFWITHDDDESYFYDFIILYSTTCFDTIHLKFYFDSMFFNRIYLISVKSFL